MTIIEYFSTLFKGSPKTANKAKADGIVEAYSEIGKKTRKQIFYHYLNGTDIPALIHTATTGIIGEGLSIQSRTGNVDIDNAFEDLISEHSERNNFEVTKRFSRDDALIMSISEKMRKGGLLVRHRNSNRWNIPYKLEFIGVDMINVSKYDRENNIVNGLKKDKDGAVISYFIYTDDTRISYTEISADEISPYMDLWMDISQYTAVSRLSQMLPELDDMLEYQRQELAAATDRSQGSVFWHTKMYDTVIDAMNGLYQKLKAEQKEITSDNFAELTEIQRTITRKMSAEGIIPGGVKAIPAEDKVTQLTSNTATVYEAFNENNKNNLTASQNRSRVITYKDMKNTNWATINALSSIDEKQNATDFRQLKEYLLDDYLKRLFTVGVATGKIPLTWNEFYKNKRKYFQWEILRQERVVSDETKAATANDKNLKNGLITKQEIYAKRRKDYKTEILQQHKVEIELRQEIEAMYKEAGYDDPYIQQEQANKANQPQQQGVTNNA